MRKKLGRLRRRALERRVEGTLARRRAERKLEETLSDEAKAKLAAAFADAFLGLSDEQVLELARADGRSPEDLAELKEQLPALREDLRDFIQENSPDTEQPASAEPTRH